MRISKLVTIAVGLLGLAACSTIRPDPVPGSEAFMQLGIEKSNAPSADVWIGGQPSPEQFDALPDVGVGRAISLRAEDEDGAGWEEERAAMSGVAFFRVAVSGPEDLTKYVVERFDAALSEADGPVFAYCRSANRVGALMALRAAWKQGRSREEALQIGRDHGLTRFEPVVEELLAP